MRMYKATLIPKSSFATPLQGDTLFGQICWAIVYIWNEKRLDKLLEKYKEKPFLVVSDGFISRYFPKPKMPSRYLKEDPNLKKQNRKKTWISFEHLQSGEFNKAEKEDDIVESKDKKETIVRNSINYKTSTTDGDSFAPYGVEELFLNKKDLYFLLDEEQFKKEELQKCLNLISQMGYGKDTTIGKGRFEISELSEFKVNFDSKTYMALSPFSFENQNDDVEDIFYEPFIKFGKFGGDRAFQNAFKKPILFINSGSVIVFKEKPNKPYFGKAIENISDSFNKAVHQGYTILLPIKDIS